MATQKTQQYLNTLAQRYAPTLNTTGTSTPTMGGPTAPAQPTKSPAPTTTGTMTAQKMASGLQAQLQQARIAQSASELNALMRQINQGRTGTTSVSIPTYVNIPGLQGTTVDPVMAKYASYVSKSLARSEPGEKPVWDDQWQPQIEAIQGGRYGDYESPYQAKLDGLLDRILTRPEFSYNWSDDPLYRQYAARYQQQARQGMQDTMGQAAGLTGGYGSSYATAAGNQAYAQQMQGLNDRAMELYQLAKDRYDTQGAEMRANMGLLEQREAANRGMFQDDRDTWYGRLDADIANLRNSQLMGWSVYQDAADREMAEREMAWDQYKYWNNLYEAMRAEQEAKGGGGGGGGARTYTRATGDGDAAEDDGFDSALQRVASSVLDQLNKKKKNPGSVPTAVKANMRSNMDR